MEQMAAQQASLAHETARPPEAAPGMPGTAWDKAVRVGLNTGLVLAGLNVVNWLAGLSAGGAFDGQSAGGAFVNRSILDFALGATCLLFLARLALYFVAGHRAATRTGRTSLGALAGMVAGVTDGVSGLIVTLLGVALFPVYALTLGYTVPAETVGQIILVAVMETVALSAAGLLLGAVGGGTIESDRYPRAA